MNIRNIRRAIGLENSSKVTEALHYLWKKEKVIQKVIHNFEPRSQAAYKLLDKNATSENKFYQDILDCIKSYSGYMTLAEALCELSGNETVKEQYASELETIKYARAISFGVQTGHILKGKLGNYETLSQLKDMAESPDKYWELKDKID